MPKPYLRKNQRTEITKEQTISNAEKLAALKRRSELADVVANHMMTRTELTAVLLAIMYTSDNTPADWDRYFARAKRSNRQ